MIINLNGWPGVGKLTTARELSKLTGGRLLDNHTLLNFGKALADEGSPEYYALVRAVRSVAFEAILKLPSALPVIFTTTENARRIVHEDRGLLRKEQDPELLVELARTRTLFDDGATFRTIIDNSDLSPEETAFRIHSWVNNTSA
ncbi:hypothetical protein AB9F36_07665 [Rhizobium leguminosarum]|uniref:hypothetical protein n=1 Tax=Rhizobium leguminosarum TaxID=384 RepID=UPI003F9987A2